MIKTEIVKHKHSGTLKREKEFADKMYEEFRTAKFKLDRIIELINRGDTNDYIWKIISYNTRNAPYDLTTNIGFQLKFMPINGKTKEHVNGRTTFALYGLWAILQGEIKTVDDYIKFYKNYCIWIYTSYEFNIDIKPFQNDNDKGAIDPKIYMKKYEKVYGKLKDSVAENFKLHFLYNKYNVITKNDIINYCRRHIQNKNWIVTYSGTSNFICSLYPHSGSLYKENCLKPYKLSDHHNQFGEAWWNDGNVVNFKCAFSALKLLSEHTTVFIALQSDMLEIINAYEKDKAEQLSKPIIEDTICTIPDCNRKVYKIGWCRRHYDMMLPRKFSK